MASVVLTLTHLRLINLDHNVRTTYEARLLIQRLDNKLTEVLEEVGYHSRTMLGYHNNLIPTQT